MRKEVTNTEPMWENCRAAAGLKDKNDWVARFAPVFALTFPIIYLFLAQNLFNAFELIQEDMSIKSTDLFEYHFRSDRNSKFQYLGTFVMKHHLFLQGLLFVKDYFFIHFALKYIGF